MLRQFFARAGIVRAVDASGGLEQARHSRIESLLCFALCDPSQDAVTARKVSK